MAKINKTAREILQDALESERRVHAWHTRLAESYEAQAREYREYADQAAARAAAIEEAMA